MPNEIATHGGPPHRASDRSASARRGGSSGRGTGDAMDIQDMGMAQARSKKLGHANIIAMREAAQARARASQCADVIHV
jgi:hypothetical protein